MMRLVLVLALLLLLPLCSAARAHALDLSTARVTLRDDHIEVLAEIDLMLLLEAGPTAVAISGEAELRGWLERARQVLEAKTQLTVDGTQVALTLGDLPTPPQVRALAATLSAAGRDHGELVRLRFAAPQAVPGARTLTLTLPAPLGPVLVSFVQPATRYAPPGMAVAFDVLRRTAEAPRAAPRPWLGAAALVALGGLLCIVSCAAARLLRRAAPRWSPLNRHPHSEVT